MSAADLVTTPTVDPTPTDPNEKGTHAVVLGLSGNAGSTGQAWEDLVVHYRETPKADVSNVGLTTLGTVGVDRDGDDPGTRVDVHANVSEVTAGKDGTQLRIGLTGNLTLRSGDDVVAVLRPVQNPQNAGTAAVEVTVNSQGAADTATGSVTYEYNDATVTFRNQTTGGTAVTVASVTLSEGGFVAVQNDSGALPGEVRGRSAYLPAGTHETVTVELDEELTRNRTLTAQVYLDTDADRRYDYAASGGEVDEPYLTRDDNIMAADDAAVTLDGDTGTPTPTDALATARPTPTASGAGDTPTPTRSAATATGTGSAGTPTPTDSAATVTPTPAPGDGTGTATSTPTAPDTGQPGFGLIAAVLALLAAALLAWSR